MSIKSENVDETEEKFVLRADYLKNPATGRSLRPSHFLKRNQKRGKEVSGAVVEEVDVNIIKEKKTRIGIEEEDLENSRKELKKFTLQ